jgi:hypothetical protein
VHDEGKGWVQQVIWAGAVFGSVLVLAIATWQGVRLCYKPSWVREREMSKKRKKPVPTSGQISIVVTDIENYSGASLVLHGTAAGGFSVDPKSDEAGLCGSQSVHLCCRNAEGVLAYKLAVGSTLEC